MMPTPDLDNRGCHSHTIRMAQSLQNSSTYQKKFSPDWSKGLFISHHRHFVVNRGADWEYLDTWAGDTSLYHRNKVGSLLGYHGAFNNKI